MKKKVYVLGNPFDKTDSKVINLLPFLIKKFSDFKFETYDPTEEININTCSDLIMLDTGINIDKTILFRDFRYFDLSPRNSVHDYDLPLQLGLMKKLNKIKNVYIIVVPPRGKTSKILQEISTILSTI